MKYIIIMLLTVTFVLLFMNAFAETVLPLIDALTKLLAGRGV